MLTEAVKRDINQAIQLQEEGRDRYRIFTPFIYDDGDHLSIVLKKSDDIWVFSDEADIDMRLLEYRYAQKLKYKQYTAKISKLAIPTRCHL